MRFMIVLLVSVMMCGCSCSEDANDRVAESIAEKLIESQTGDKADVEVEEDGMRIKTKDGQMTITSGNSAEIPDSFPKDIPIYNGAVLNMAMEVPKGFSMIFSTKDNASEVSQWYLAQMDNQGWHKEAFVDMGEQKTLTFSKNDRDVSLSVISENGQTHISLRNANN